jgi:hypothetical protein
MKLRRARARLRFRLRRIAEAPEDGSLKFVKSIPEDGLTCRHVDRLPTAHMKDPAANGDMVLVALAVTPSEDPDRELRHEIRMPRLDAERSGGILGANVAHAAFVDYEAYGGCHPESHGWTSLSLASCFPRASSKAPTM